MVAPGLGLAWEYAMMRLRAFFGDEKGAVDIVAIVVLIGIAVVLAVFFRDQLANLLKDLFKTIGIGAKDAVETQISE